MKILLFKYKIRIKNYENILIDVIYFWFLQEFYMIYMKIIFVFQFDFKEKYGFELLKQLMIYFV